MKGLQKLTSFAAGVSVLTLASLPAAPMTAVAAQLPLDDLDLSIVRAAAAVAAPVVAVVSTGQASGEADAADNVKCLVKFWDLDELKNRSYDTIAFVQVKLVCNDTPGTVELLIEQNDQIVVAQTVVNNQTNVTMLNATVKLIEEQEENFCIAVARAGNGSTFAVVAQECFHLDDNLYDMGYDTGKGGNSHG